MTSHADTRSAELGAPQEPRAPVRSGAWLLLTRGEKLTTMPLRAGQPLVLGRRASCELVLDDPEVSGEHARVELAGAGVKLTDLGSKNGLRVGQRKLHEVTLADGDEVLIGATLLRAYVPAAFSEPVHGPTSYGAFVHELQREVERARLFRRSLALLALKHAPLGNLSQALDPLLRCVDVLGRYTDEVALLLAPELDGDAARKLTTNAITRLTAGCAALALYPAHGASAHELLDGVLSRLRRAGPEDRMVVSEAAPSAQAGDAIVHDPRMHRLYETVARVARVNMPVLVLGETGAGKELFARALHTQSPRASGPFKAVNCGAIPSSLLESELFGHERGAFTGADRTRLGMFEQAQGGTIFLDEIGELDDRAQAALLRVLESRRITRVGGGQEIDVDVRVVAATHRDLESMVERGSFRRDLWYRLAAMTLHVPPLRERPGEIVPLSQLFLRQLGHTGKVHVQRIHPHALDALCSYSWPGNVRQLRHVIERACAIADGPEIGLDDLPDNVLDALRGRAPSAHTPGSATLDEQLARYERQLLEAALAAAGGNQSQAARALGVPRRTLSYRMQVLGLRGGGKLP